jgi:hypothetical protein
MKVTSSNKLAIKPRLLFQFKGNRNFTSGSYGADTTTSTITLTSTMSAVFQKNK